MTANLYAIGENGIAQVNANFMQRINSSMPVDISMENLFGNSPIPFQGDFLEKMQNSEMLKSQLELTKNEQGVIGSALNGIKGLFGFGASTKKAEKAIQKYQNGELSFEEASSTVNSLSTKQKGSVDLVTNIGAGVAVAVGVATGGIGLLAGALIGAGIKAGAKFIDRATNKVEGDALDAKQILMDSATGALDGVVTVATAGMNKAATVAGQTVKEAFAAGALQGAKQGVVAGAAMGGGNYTINAMFDENTDFTLGGLAGATVHGAVAGGLTGAVAGGLSNGVAQNRLNHSSQGLMVSENKGLVGANKDTSAIRQGFDNNGVSANTGHNITLSDIEKAVTRRGATSKQANEALLNMMKIETNPAIKRAYSAYLKDQSANTLKKLYKTAMRVYHPDLNSSPVANNMTQTYGAIYTILMPTFA